MLASNVDSEFLRATDQFQSTDPEQKVLVEQQKLQSTIPKDSSFLNRENTIPMRAETFVDQSIIAQNKMLAGEQDYDQYFDGMQRAVEKNQAI